MYSTLHVNYTSVQCLLVFVFKKVLLVVWLFDENERKEDMTVHSHEGYNGLKMNDGGRWIYGIKVIRKNRFKWRARK